MRDVKCFRRPPQVARGECNFGLGYDAPRTGHCLFRTKGARGTPQEFLRSRKFTELRHRDAAKRKCWRIVAQRNSLQRSEGITRRKRTCCSRDQRVHANPATLVTPTPSMPRAKYSA
jgi:hypothetical protein